MSERRKINNDLFIGLFLTSASVFLLFETMKINPMAARFPRVVYGLFIGMSVLLTILGIRKTLRPELALKSDFLLNFRVIRAPLMVFFILSAYMALMYLFGFFISTAVFVPVIMLFYGIRTVRTIVLTNIILNAFVYFVFIRVLRIVLP